MRKLDSLAQDLDSNRLRRSVFAIECLSPCDKVSNAWKQVYPCDKVSLDAEAGFVGAEVGQK